MKCLILNAGLGTRMGGGLPKALLPLRKKDETILSRQIGQLHRNNEMDITVATTQLHYDRYFSQKQHGVNYKITVNRGTECINTLFQCFDILEDNSDLRGCCLILHGDVITEDGVVGEILSLNHWIGFQFIGNSTEIFAVLIDVEGLDTLVKIIQKEIDTNQWKLWDLYYYLNSPYMFTPHGFICDIDTGIEYEQLKNIMMVERL